MKTILCYGDSNTWGFDPASITAPYPVRWGPSVRWTGVLGAELGGEYRVIEEGLNGRTTVHDDALMVDRNGRRYLPPCLESHKPINLVILMLGTNDLKIQFGLTPGQIAAGAGLLVKMIRQSETGPRNQAPQVLLIGPAATGDMSHAPDLAEKFPDAEARSRRFPALYEAVAKQHGVAYLNAQDYVTPSAQDGLHLEVEAHAALGGAVAAAVKRILPV